MKSISSIILGITAAVGIAAGSSSASAATIEHVDNRYGFVTLGHPFDVDTYRVITQKNDNLDSIAAQFSAQRIRHDYLCQGVTPVAPSDLIAQDPELAILHHPPAGTVYTVRVIHVHHTFNHIF